MRGQIYDSSAIFIEKLHVSNYALLLVVALLLLLIAFLLIGVPMAIKTIGNGGR